MFWIFPRFHGDLLGDLDTVIKVPRDGDIAAKSPAYTIIHRVLVRIKALSRLGKWQSPIEVRNKRDKKRQSPFFCLMHIWVGERVV